MYRRSLEYVCNGTPSTCNTKYVFSKSRTFFERKFFLSGLNFTITRDLQVNMLCTLYGPYIGTQSKLEGFLEL